MKIVGLEEGDKVFNFLTEDGKLHCIVQDHLEAGFNQELRRISSGQYSSLKLKDGRLYCKASKNLYARGGGYYDEEDVFLGFTWKEVITNVNKKYGGM